MGTRGITDTIWHFIGYMHLSETIARSEVLFDGRAPRTGDDTPDLAYRDQPSHFAEPEDTGSRGIAFQDRSFSDDPSSRNNASTDAWMSLAPIGTRVMPAALLQNTQGNSQFTFASPFASPQRDIAVSYAEGGLDNKVKVNQNNQMEDNDLITTDAIVSPDGTVFIPNQANLLPMLATMFAQAAHAVPDTLPFNETIATQVIIKQITDHDQAWAERGETPWQGQLPDSAITPLLGARYVDGELSTEIPAPVNAALIAPWRIEASDGDNAQVALTPEVQSTILDLARNGDASPAQRAVLESGFPGNDQAIASISTKGPTEPETLITETGENTQINAAIIIDRNEMTKSMIVGGDYFYSQGVVQINILVDGDHIDIASAGNGFASLFSAGNAVHNIAEFRHEEMSAKASGAVATPNWKVDVFRGDFYDIKSLYQYNNLIDGDRTVQSNSGVFSSFETGANEQINLARIADIGFYDLIIIEGNYHRANWIAQYNIVLDVDFVHMLRAGDGEAELTTGYNSLTNNATIATYESSAFQPMNASHGQLMGALSSGQTILSPNPEWQLAGNASGTLKVLYVQGDYYDVNTITQLNVLYDVDQTWQASNSPNVALGLATGGNLALNEARIVDPGTLSASKYLGGEAYEASVLIQTNIVTDSDTIRIHDTQSLIPEFVAFAQHNDGQPDCELTPRPLCDPSQHYDNMGNILS